MAIGKITFALNLNFKLGIYERCHEKRYYEYYMEVFDYR